MIPNENNGFPVRKREKPDVEQGLRAAPESTDTAINFPVKTLLLHSSRKHAVKCSIKVDYMFLAGQL